MSLATRQTRIKLHLIKGLLDTIETNDLLTEDTRAIHYYARDLVQGIIDQPDKDGSNMAKNNDWVTANLIKWGQLVDSINMPIYLEMFVTMALQLVEDICGKIRDKAQLASLHDLRAALISECESLGGDEFVLLEESDLLLKEMDRLIGFSR